MLSHSRESKTSMSRFKKRLCHTPNQPVSLKNKTNSGSEYECECGGVYLDNGLHTNELWCEDAWCDSTVEILLKLQQLAHEVEVWRDDGPPGFDKLVGVCHGHPGVLHQVGNYDGG